MKKYRRIWIRISQVLTREVSTTRMKGNFYKVVIKSVLLYGLEI